MDSLGIDQFGVLGWSSGGPHALACAAQLPRRVTAAGLRSGVGPLDRPRAFEGLDAMDRWFAVTSARRPGLAALALRLQAAIARRAPGLALRGLMSDLGEADRVHLAALGPDLMATFSETTRQGPYGVIDDYRRWIAPWPFAFDAIDAPVDVWQGDDDNFVPMLHAEDLVARLPRATLHRLPGEEHFSIAARFELILDGLLAAASTDASR